MCADWQDVYAPLSLVGVVRDDEEDCDAESEAAITSYETGATRSKRTHKFDYTGFTSPLAINIFANYMHKHRLQSDGKLRDSDNWKKGIPNKDCLESLDRHVRSIIAISQGIKCINADDGEEETMEDVLCAARFNIDCILHNTAVEDGRSICHGVLDKGDSNEES